MSDINQASAQPGMASLVGDILANLQKLVRQELALAQHEVTQAWDKGQTAAALLASALVFFAVGGVLLGVMLAKLLDQLWPNHEWACYGIVGGLVVLVAAGLTYCGLNWIKKVHVSLPKTIEPLREDAVAISAAVSGNGVSSEPLLKG